MAEPGGIAVSRAVRDVTELQVEYAFVDGGEHQAKNVSRTAADLPRAAAHGRVDAHHDLGRAAARRCASAAPTAPAASTASISPSTG